MTPLALSSLSFSVSSPSLSLLASSLSIDAVVDTPPPRPPPPRPTSTARPVGRRSGPAPHAPTLDAVVLAAMDSVEARALAAVGVGGVGGAVMEEVLERTMPPTA